MAADPAPAAAMSRCGPNPYRYNPTPNSHLRTVRGACATGTRSARSRCARIVASILSVFIFAFDDRLHLQGMRQNHLIHYVLEPIEHHLPVARRLHDDVRIA